MNHKSNNIGINARLVEYMFSNRKKDVSFSIARSLLLRSHELHNITIEEIASLSNTTPASVSKFCHRLKFNSFKELRTTPTRVTTSPIFTVLQLMAIEKGIETAIASFYEEAQTRFMEMFKAFDMEQIQRIAHRLNDSQSIAVFCGLHGFSAANLFWEILLPFKISVFEINRDSETAVLCSLLNTEDLVLIISLTGRWMDKRISELQITEEIAKKIILITHESSTAEKYSNLCSEIVSFEKYNNFFASNYTSANLLQCFFILLTTYLGVIRD